MLFRLFLVLTIISCLCSNITKAESKPNIVLFLVDDMGWQDTSVPFHSEATLFNKHYRTPGMERLAKQGIKFSQAYSASVCSPTRTSILIGQNPVRHHVTNWTLYPNKDQSRKSKVVNAPRSWRKEGAQPWDVTLPSLLKKAGYRTIHAGKAHFGAYDTPGSDPRNLGFDVNIAGHAAGGPGHFHGKKNYGNKVKGGHTRPWGVPGLEKYHSTDTHLTDATTIEALKEVERSVEMKKPFYLYLAHYAVHAPIQEHRPYVDNYRGKNYPGTNVAIDETEARYASMVEGMDASLVSLQKKLDELKVAKNTLIIFTSDNGGLTAHARGNSPRTTGRDSHNWPLREGKGSCYEGGTRVPFLMAWAQLDAENKFQKALPIQAGSHSQAMIICEDLFPSILSWAGTSAPKEHTIDGRDITSWVLNAKKASDPNHALLFHYPHVWGPRRGGYQPHSAIRLGDWKAIHFYQSGTWELYNLATDIGERTDLANKHPEKLEALARRMKAKFDTMGAQYPIDSTTQKDVPPRWPQPPKNLVIDGKGPGWVELKLEDFINVNCDKDTWSMNNGIIHATGKPIGVIRSKEQIKNLELVVEWRHLKKAGNSGVFLWASPQSIKNLEMGRGRLPHGIEVQVLDLGYAEFYEKRYKKKADWFTSHGDVFPTGPAKMKPFPPVAPNGKRSFPSKNLTKGVGQWNHYYIRAIDGEVRLWVNGEEVSGGTDCQPANGYLCLESEGSPVEFRNLRIRKLP